MSTTRAITRRTGITIAVVAAVAAGIIALTFLTGGIQRLTASFRGETSQIERVQADGAYRIAQYELFYDRAGRIDAIEQQICTMHDADLPDDQVATNVLALTNQRIDLVEQYNADAAKEDTRANFKASDLPYEITQDVTC